MSDLSKQEQIQAMLRPLAEGFAAQVATTVMSFVQQSVREEVRAVLDRALPEGETAPLAQAETQAVAVIEAPVAPPAPAPKAVVKRAKPIKAAKVKVLCSKRGCDGAWYRPSGRDRKLCYKHFIDAGGKPPPGKKPKKK